MATDSNIHATVSNHLAEFTKSNCSKPRQKQPGVAVIAVSIYMSQRLDTGNVLGDTVCYVQCCRSGVQLHDCPDSLQ